MILRRMQAAVLAGILACGGERTPETAASAGDPVPPPAPADSLVLAVGGATVWHTLSRGDTNPAGEPCLERTLEIRRDGAPPVRVPLLYTRDVPRIIDDSTLEARVYLDCTPGDRYRIDMRTGQPTPIR
ncbi:MAG TPA: hypothetical protein VFT04_06360 [Gemmatimonadales bacterium]|nr:hypothetical protein [Gemmatimonadales bacterium]